MLPIPLKISGKQSLGWLVRARVADLIKRAFDELFPLITDVVIDGAHRLNRAGSRPSKSEFAIRHFACVQSKRSIAKNDKATIGECAAFIFVEIEHDFFIVKIVF